MKKIILILIATFLLTGCGYSVQKKQDVVDPYKKVPTEKIRTDLFICEAVPATPTKLCLICNRRRNSDLAMDCFDVELIEQNANQ